MNMKKNIYFILLSFISYFSFGQEKTSTPILFFLHTDWCQYCNMMKAKVLDDSSLKKYQDTMQWVYINPEKNQWQDFPMAIRERMHSIQPLSDLFTWTHALGNMNGVLAYPTLLIYSADNQLVLKYSGYLPKKDFIRILDALEHK